MSGGAIFTASNGFWAKKMQACARCRRRIDPTTVGLSFLKRGASKVGPSDEEGTAKQQKASSALSKMIPFMKGTGKVGVSEPKEGTPKQQKALRDQFKKQVAGAQKQIDASLQQMAMDFLAKKTSDANRKIRENLAEMRKTLEEQKLHMSRDKWLQKNNSLKGMEKEVASVHVQPDIHGLQNIIEGVYNLVLATKKDGCRAVARQLRDELISWTQIEMTAMASKQDTAKPDSSEERYAEGIQEGRHEIEEMLHTLRSKDPAPLPVLPPPIIHTHG